MRFFEDRDITASAVYMFLYEIGSRAVKDWGQDKHETATVFGIFVAGGVAGNLHETSARCEAYHCVHSRNCLMVDNSSSRCRKIKNTS